MNILDTIVARKKEELIQRKALFSLEALQAMPHFNRTCFSTKSFLADPNRTGIIAEFKRQSPSKGLINGQANVVEVTGAYAQWASAVSVLTDTDFLVVKPKI